LFTPVDAAALGVTAPITFSPDPAGALALPETTRRTNPSLVDVTRERVLGLISTRPPFENCRNAALFSVTISSPSTNATEEAAIAGTVFAADLDRPGTREPANRARRPSRHGQNNDAYKNISHDFTASLNSITRYRDFNPKFHAHITLFCHQMYDITPTVPLLLLYGSAVAIPAIQATVIAFAGMARLKSTVLWRAIAASDPAHATARLRLTGSGAFNAAPNAARNVAAAGIRRIIAPTTPISAKICR